MGEKRVGDKTRGQKYQFLLKMHSFKKKKKKNQNIPDHLHERGHSGELDKAANAVCRAF